MNSSSSDEAPLSRRSEHSRALYTQQVPGSSQQSNTRHEVSDAEEEEEDESYARFREENVIDVDDAITVMLSSLNFEQNRGIPPTELDDDTLRRLHEKIYTLISSEPDDVRRRRLRKALPASNCVREQVFYLRRSPTSPSTSYFHRLSAALDTIVKDSFEEEYRKVATILGLVESLAEVLILEVHSFGIPQNNHSEHRSIRKLIANALTNLTFGQIHSKRRLCSYEGFIRCVVRIIIESPNVTQVYAGLVRNLSWMADADMSESLKPTVHALALASINAQRNKDEGCVKATLSALWNLASHSVENKRTICETPNCLAVLVGILTTDSRQTAIVDSATGILKYVSQYLASTSTHLDLRNMLLIRLVGLLGSSSFTILTNTLGAIANLISKDPHLQSMIRQDMHVVQRLNVLRNSTREDIRTAVKNVLNVVNQPGHARYGDMSCSMAVGQHHQQQQQHETIMQHSFNYPTTSPRLLPLRQSRASPGRFMPQMAPVDQRSYSLPRQYRPPQMSQSYQPEQPPQIVPQPQQIVEENNDMVEIQSETAMGTRANSTRSLGSTDPGSVMNQTGWNSSIDTAANSSRALSPVSDHDLPDSPTQCAQHYNLFPVNDEKKDLEFSSEQQTPVFTQPMMPNTTPMAPYHPALPLVFPPPTSHQMTSSTTSSSQNTTYVSGGSTNTMTRGSDCGETGDNLANMLITPTYALLNGGGGQQRKVEDLESPDDVLPGPSFYDEDYAIMGGSTKQMVDDENDLLSRSIKSEMPSTSQQIRVSPRLNGFFSPPQSQSSPKPPKKLNDAERLLRDAIQSEMPKDSIETARAHSKNEEADRRDDINMVSRELVDRQGSPMEKSSFTTRLDSFKANETMRIEENDEIDTSIPADCYEDQDDDGYGYYDEEDDLEATQFEDGVNPHLTIDCSILEDSEVLATSTPKTSKVEMEGVREAQRVVISGRKTRLPVPKTNGMLVDKVRKPVSSRPRLPPKPIELSKYYAMEQPQQQHNGSIDEKKDDTIYVNAPIVEANEEERIYMNAMGNQRKSGESSSQASSTSSFGNSTKSAIVTPFNYQKSSFISQDANNSSNEPKTVQPNSKQMLVTIV